MASIGTSDWTERRGSVAFQLALATFGILALELALIRWTSSQIRIFAYFSNLVLISAFLGMGLGVALGRRHPRLVHWTLPMLLILAIPLGFAEELNLVRMHFPDQAISFWGADQAAGGILKFVSTLTIFIALLCMIILTFVCAGAPVGHLFSKLPTLRAYSADLLGSLLGIVAFTLVTFLDATPPVWFAIGCLPFLWLSRRPLSLVAFVGIGLLSWQSIGNAVYSPYNRIEVDQSPDQSAIVKVNRDFHQFVHDLSDENLANAGRSENEVAQLLHVRDVYDIPFQLNEARGRALVVGAGTGNDVQAAVRNGYESVVSVEIDRRIVGLGMTLHPERVYDNPAVEPVVNDARAYFEQYQGEPFDVICYGLVDSHAMFSAMSSLRLENYLYSEQGIRSAWSHVSDRGHLSISFSVFAGDWIAERLYWTIARATGVQPVAVYHGMHHGATFIVARDGARIDHERLEKYPRLAGIRDAGAVMTVSDDWPFLYVRPGVVPWGYLIVLGVVLAIAVIATPLAFGRSTVTKDFDPALFLMGAAFLLIETKGVTSLSLLFGSTWIVNSAIFAGVLTMVLIANIAVERYRLRQPMVWFAFLLLSVVLVGVFEPAWLNNFSLVTRGALGGLINALPIGFAGVIVSILLVRSSNPTASLGSNLLGAVVGGCLEYLSMYLGLRALVVVAFGLYLLAFLRMPRKTAPLRALAEATTGGLAAQPAFASEAERSVGGFATGDNPKQTTSEDRR